MRIRLIVLTATLIASTLTAVAEDSRHLGQRFESNLSIQETLVIAAANVHSDTAVRLMLRGGGELEGAVHAYRPDKASVALVHADGSNSIAALGDIVSVTVIDPGAAKLAFQGNRIFIEPGDTVPSPLAFRRQLRDLSTDSPVAVIAEFSDIQIESANCRFYSTRVFGALSSAIDRALADDIGREALSQIGNRIQVMTSTESPLKLEAEGSHVVLQFNCEAPLDADYAERIVHRLEEIL